MSPELKTLLTESGIDVETDLKIFAGLEESLIKYLKKFLLDPSYANLCEAIKKEDIEEAFRASHTLKGIAINLSMTPLVKATTEQCDFFRQKDFEKGKEKFSEVTETYNKIVTAIRKID